MMRQYELVERVQTYDPNADEALLNRAYVYAMKAHGHQTRASGDPYFSHPLEVAAILTDLQARRRDDRRRPPARRYRGYGRHTNRDRSAVRQGDRRARRRADQDQEARSRQQESRAGRELPQAAAGDLERYPRAARQARRSPAQHAHARAHEAGEPPAHLPGDARHLCPAGGSHGHADVARGIGGTAFRWLHPEAYGRP